MSIWSIDTEFMGKKLTKVHITEKKDGKVSCRVEFTIHYDDLFPLNDLAYFIRNNIERVRTIMFDCDKKNIIDCLQKYHHYGEAYILTRLYPCL